MERRAVLKGAAALALASLWTTTPADAAPMAASLELQRQNALAVSEGKKLFVLFHASWCSYCRLFDRFLADPAASAVLDRQFNIFHLRALERTDAQKALQLAGAEDVYRRFTHPGDGLPFYVVLDAEGRPIVTSISPESGENIGFPVAKHELDTFGKILKRAAPDLAAADLATLRASCVRVMQR